MSLGKAIVGLYVVTFLAAVISARTLADRELVPPEVSGVDPHATEPSRIID